MKQVSDRISRLQTAASHGALSFNRKLGSFGGTNPYEVKNLSINMLTLLQREGYIRYFTIHNSSRRCLYVTVYLKYNGQGSSAFRSIFTVSTPGRPVYVSTYSLWQPRSTNGILIMSTPRGLFTDREARRLSLGGHVLFGIF